MQKMLSRIWSPDRYGRPINKEDIVNTRRARSKRKYQRSVRVQLSPNQIASLNAGKCVRIQPVGYEDTIAITMVDPVAKKIAYHEAALRNLKARKK